MLPFDGEVNETLTTRLYAVVLIALSSLAAWSMQRTSNDCNPAVISGESGCQSENLIDVVSGIFVVADLVALLLVVAGVVTLLRKRSAAR